MKNPVYADHVYSYGLLREGARKHGTGTIRVSTFEGGYNCITKKYGVVPDNTLVKQIRGTNDWIIIQNGTHKQERVTSPKRRL